MGTAMAAVVTPWVAAAAPRPACAAALQWPAPSPPCRVADGKVPVQLRGGPLDPSMMTFDTFTSM